MPGRRLITPWVIREFARQQERHSEIISLPSLPMSGSMSRASISVFGPVGCTSASGQRGSFSPLDSRPPSIKISQVLSARPPSKPFFVKRCSA